MRINRRRAFLLSTIFLVPIALLVIAWFTLTDRGPRPELKVISGSLHGERILVEITFTNPRNEPIQIFAVNPTTPAVLGSDAREIETRSRYHGPRHLEQVWPTNFEWYQVPANSSFNVVCDVSATELDTVAYFEATYDLSPDGSINLASRLREGTPSWMSRIPGYKTIDQFLVDRNGVGIAITEEIRLRSLIEWKSANKAQMATPRKPSD